jgi:hypothetical protein
VGAPRSVIAAMIPARTSVVARAGRTGPHDPSDV